MSAHLVVVGAGPAGLFAVETARRLDPTARITLVSDEPPYARMVLPYMLAGEVPEAHVFTGDEATWARLRVEWRPDRVRALEPDRRLLRLDGGGTLGFDRCLLATGSTPVRPDIPGARGRRVHTLWTLDDARRTLAVLEGRRARVVFLGAGFIGLIVLNALWKRGCQVSVAELEGEVLPRMLDRDAGALVRGWLASRGVAVHVGVRAREIGDEGGAKAVRLEDGTVLRGDLVVLATGVRPNAGLAEGAGLRVEQGIVVDHHLRTSAEGIYAGGDCAQGPVLFADATAVHAIQPTAVEHGRVAGAHLAGHPVRYPGSLGMNILDVVGLHCASFGRWRDEGDAVTVLRDPTIPLYRKLVWDRDRVVGAILVGPASDMTLVNDLGMLKGLVQSGWALGPWAALLRERPTDLRRAFLGAGAPAALLARTLLEGPALERDYRFGGARAEAERPRAADVAVQVKLDPVRGGRAP